MAPKFKFVFLGRLKKEKPAAPLDIPTEHVRMLANQGLSEADIIKRMKDEGYAFEQINKALSEVTAGAPAPSAQAQTASAVSAIPQMAALPYAPEAAGAPAAAPPAEFVLSQAEARERPEELLPVEVTPAAPPSITMEEVEGVIEQMLEERLNEISNKFADLDDKVSAFDAKISGTSAKIDDVAHSLRDNLETLKRSIEMMDGRLGELEPRLSSVEKAFKDIIPNLVDSVREIREIASRGKRAAPMPSLESEEFKPAFSPAEEKQEEKSRVSWE